MLGNGFTVYETHAIAGGVAVSEDTTSGKKIELFSRNVMRIEIPANARTKKVRTGDADGVQRTVIDVHVATPNGISNHLLVEADPKDTKSGTAAPVQTAVTRSLNISYVLLRRADVAGAPNAPSFVPVLMSVSPGNAEIDLNWPAAPPVAASVDATINFPNPSVGGADLSIPVKGLANRSGTTVFPVTGDTLTTLAGDLIDQLGNFDLLNPQNPPTQLMSNKITLTPSAGGGSAQDASASGPLVINFTYVPVVAHVTPAALSVKLGNPLAPDPKNPSNVTIDWLGGLSKVQASVSFDLTTTLNGVITPIGPINFTDGVGGNIQLKGGMRVIQESDFLTQLNPLVAPLLAAKKVVAGTSKINARTITITPQLDGIPWCRSSSPTHLRSTWFSKSRRSRGPRSSRRTDDLGATGCLIPHSSPESSRRHHRGLIRRCGGRHGPGLDPAWSPPRPCRPACRRCRSPRRHWHRRPVRRRGLPSRLAAPGCSSV